MYSIWPFSLQEMNPNCKSENVCLRIANKFLNTDDIHILLPLGMSWARIYARPKPISHLLQAPSDILLHKGYELGFLFSHLSLWWHLQYTCKWVAKRGEHRIINIQLHRAAANDIFAALFFEGVDIAKGVIAKVLQVKSWGMVESLSRNPMPGG